MATECLPLGDEVDATSGFGFGQPELGDVNKLPRVDLDGRSRTGDDVAGGRPTEPAVSVKNQEAPRGVDHQRSPPPAPPVTRSAAKKSNDSFEDPALDLLDDSFANDDYDDLVDVEADFDEIMGVVELSDREVDSIFNAFYGDPSQTQLLGDFARARSRDRLERPHAAPASSDILNLVGDINYQCWCGNEYSIREGCADYFSNQ